MNRFLFLLLFLSISLSSLAQKAPLYFSTALGFMSYQHNTIDVDPGPNWKGHYLSDRDGFDFSANVGVILKERFNVGVGMSYFNFEGIHGMGSFSDLGINILPKSKFSPIVYWHAGYSHLWNQYAGGTGTFLSDLGLRVQYKFSPKVGIQASAGLLSSQQSFIRPYRIGVIFY